MLKLTLNWYFRRQIIGIVSALLKLTLYKLYRYLIALKKLVEAFKCLAETDTTYSFKYLAEIVDIYCIGI